MNPMTPIPHDYSPGLRGTGPGSFGYCDAIQCCGHERGAAQHVGVALLSAGLILFETSRIVNGGETNYVLKLIERSATMALASAGNAAVRSKPQFADSDYEHGRGPQGGRKKSSLSNIFD